MALEFTYTKKLDVSPSKLEKLEAIMSGNSGHATSVGFGQAESTGAIGFSDLVGSANSVAEASAAANEAKGGRMARKQTTPKKRKSTGDGKLATTPPGSKKTKPQSLEFSTPPDAANGHKDSPMLPSATALAPNHLLMPDNSLESKEDSSSPIAMFVKPADPPPEPPPRLSPNRPAASPRPTVSPSASANAAAARSTAFLAPPSISSQQQIAPPSPPEAVPALSSSPLSETTATKPKPTATLQNFFAPSPSTGAANTAKRKPPTSVPLPAVSSALAPTLPAPSLLAAASVPSAAAAVASPAAAALAPAFNVPPASCQQHLDEIKRLKEQIAGRDAEIKRLTAELDQHRLTVDGHLNDFRNRVNKVLVEALRENARRERHERDEQMLKDSQRVGRVIVTSTVKDAVTEGWEDGEAFKDLRRRQEALKDTMKEIDAALKAERYQKSKARRTSAAAAAAASSSPAPAGAGSDEDDDASEAADDHPSPDGFAKPKNPGRTPSLVDEVSRNVEILNTRLLVCKRDMEDLKKQEVALEQEQKLVIRNQKLIADERRSPWNTMPILHENRYLLLNLLGKGGFSEVYKAFDLKEYRFVACKVHHLESRWSDERKRSYTRHATREYNIHGSLRHRNVVQLFDVFGINVDAFCTVLDFCDGMDLDMYLKIRQTLTEKEARTYIVQVFSGLKYLSEQKQRIIHYDLKPGNILFDKGEVKITDFGLSKQVEENKFETELTSQGAGTYWYLPPECFQVGQAQKISPQVDIWSAGIVLYQMLYGKKPFGNGMSPEHLISSQTMSRASGSTVQFPPKPHVTDACKAFIRRCLDVNPAMRPSIHDVFTDPFFASTKVGPKV